MTHPRFVLRLPPMHLVLPSTAPRVWFGVVLLLSLLLAPGTAWSLG